MITIFHLGMPKLYVGSSKFCFQNLKLLMLL